MELLKSAYEAARDEKVKENEAVLAELGIDVKNLVGIGKEDVEVVQKKSNKSVKRKLTVNESSRDSKSLSERQRYSKRLAKEKIDNLQIEANDTVVSRSRSHGDCIDLDNDVIKRRIERLKALHDENGTTYKNPTATYEHTWMRVKSMSEKALALRMKRIESACGAHCLVKMRMFGEVLVLAGYNNLAKDAEDALQRLQALVNEP